MSELRSAAEVVITPPLGISMAGYYNDRKADDVHDDLLAHALALESGADRAAVVVCDLIGLDRELANESRGLIEERTGIPAAAVMICCTHTHTGPVISRKPSRILVADPGYADMVVRKVADAAQLAWQRRRPATLRAGSGHAEGISGNRRWWMKDGTLRTNPRFQDPELDRPAGPIDPEVGILAAYAEDGSVLAVLSPCSDEVAAPLAAHYQASKQTFSVFARGRSSLPQRLLWRHQPLDWSSQRPGLASGAARPKRWYDVVSGCPTGAGGTLLTGASVT